jgi:hypothetical protein
MTTIIGPRGWRQDQVLHRFDSSTALTPLSYDATARSVDAVLSVGSPVQRVYGVERLTPIQASPISINARLTLSLLGGPYLVPRFCDQWVENAAQKSDTLIRLFGPKLTHSSRNPATILESTRIWAPLTITSKPMHSQKLLSLHRLPSRR